MSTKETRDDVLAAREAKKLAKQKAKHKGNGSQKEGAEKLKKELEVPPLKDSNVVTPKKTESKEVKQESPKSQDVVDRAAVDVEGVRDSQKSRDQIKAERAAKKTAKQSKKTGDNVTANRDMTVRDVAETLKDIKNVAKDMQDLTAKVSALNFEANKSNKGKPKESNKGNEDSTKTNIEGVNDNQELGEKKTEEGKSKAELRAERRAKQEAQRAAKAAATNQKPAAKPKLEAAMVKTDKPVGDDVIKEKSPKPKSVDKGKPKSTSANRVNWFQHLHPEHDQKESLKKIALNSSLHPAIVKLGVQLATRVVSGSNARCIALLDAIKKMLRDYTLPAKTEFARGLESHLAASLNFLWSMRQPSASQTNAVKYFRHHLNQLPNNIDEFDAKKILQEEIDKYIEDQIDKAGQAISTTVQQKITNGDNILTYGCSSLIERILREAWTAGIKFRAVIAGNRVNGAAREMLRRLSACGLPCTYVDITAISYVMKTIKLVLLGAGSLLAHGGVVGSAGTAQTALVARAHNVPVLVACEAHKFSDQVQTDAFVYNELGDPDELIDKTDENSPLKDWRTNPNLTPLNLTYDVTPPNLITAVVTEKAMLPCTSAPVLLRTKLTEYGM
ncbi:translation initiation factor eIF-2B subunit delta isoform X2 [Hyposmocoma kahamanoa]|uniref:translation initiation factor eIF-2B subunit delta isoform X2 n=1 Tax=Hyposmocoma kahamanoa TaxID=1477025 RepID=UPI000E6D9BB9|nr:translation initiation factor eIF-2B subunit delta isoform X2 [Hyposmocoma kahamanoa]